ALPWAVVLLLAPGNRVQDGMTYPWLLVIPGFLAALWASSAKRVDRLTDPGAGGRLRRALAHGVAGVAKLRMMATSPRRHGFGLAGVTLYWVGDILCLWAALQVFDARLSLPALIVAYAT